MSRRLVLAMLILVLAVLSFPAYAQETMVSSLAVADQVSVDGTIVIPDIVLDQDGFIVVHISANDAPGPVAGFLYLPSGHYSNVKVPVDTSMLTPVVFPMLHYDTDANGVYEFTGGELDGPIAVDGSVLVAPMNLAVIDADDQLADGSFTANSVTTDQPGFLVIHISQDGAPGPVLGHVEIPAGTSTDVTVEFSAADVSATTVLFPMLHYDTDGNNVYEFTGGELDAPVVVDGAVATVAVNNAPSMRVDDQAILYGDNVTLEGEMMAPVLHAHSVLLDQNGFLVIHTEANGGPGPVAGFVYLEAGFYEEVEVPLDLLAPTAVLWPMLHYDTNDNGEYEFDGGELDGPITVDGSVVTYSVDAAPSFMADAQAVGEGSTLVFNSVVTDAPGFLVIHDDADGAPGPVLGFVSLPAGTSEDVVVTLTGTPTTGQVFPMLHYDTDADGLYEFAGDALDGPIIFGGNVVVGPLSLEP